MHYGALTGATLTAALALAAAAETYRGIDVAPEHRCAPYDRSDYRYSQSLETRIVASIGKVYGPYTGTCFEGSIRIRSVEPDPGRSTRQPVQQERQGRRRVDARDERVLVRRANPRGPTQVRAEHRPRRCHGRSGSRVQRLRRRRDAVRQAWQRCALCPACRETSASRISPRNFSVRTPRLSGRRGSRRGYRTSRRTGSR